MVNILKQNDNGQYLEIEWFTGQYSEIKWHWSAY